MNTKKFKMKNCDKCTLYGYGFHYEPLYSEKNNNIYSITFPVLKYKKTPTMFCTLYVELESGRVNLKVTQQNGEEYNGWITHDIQHSVINAKIDKSISNKLPKYNIKEVRKNGYHKHRKL